MSDTAIVYTVLIAAVELLLMTFAIFCIGFFMGYRREDNKIKTRQANLKNILTKESEEETKAQKNWQKFLNYDGSTNNENML